MPPEGGWRTWLLLGGRGSGKTRSAAEAIRDAAESGRHVQIGVIAPTADSLRRINVEGQRGLLEISPPWCRPTFSPATRTVTWPSGATVHLFSSEEPDRLRGPNLSPIWIDEFAACADPQALWDMASMALRVPGPTGEAPRAIITTTPRPIAILKSIMAAPTTVVTRSRTLDNAPNLDASTLRFLMDRYGNTTLGRQELGAELIDSSDAALWNRELLDATRVAEAPQLTRVAIGLDPSGTKRGDVAGIVAVSIDAKRELHVLADHSGRMSPEGWARKAVSAYHAHSANFIVAETNFGSEMVVQMIRQVDPRVPVKTVHASRGKAIRAEPIAMLFEQRKAHMVGVLADLETELCTWEPGGSGPSPGRLDAMVWGATELTAGAHGKPSRWVRFDWVSR